MRREVTKNDGGRDMSPQLRVTQCHGNINNVKHKHPVSHNHTNTDSVSHSDRDTQKLTQKDLIRQTQNRLTITQRQEDSGEESDSHTPKQAHNRRLRNTTLFLYKKQFIRRSRLKFGLKIIKKL